MCEARKLRAPACVCVVCFCAVGDGGGGGAAAGFLWLCGLNCWFNVRHFQRICLVEWRISSSHWIIFIFCCPKLHAVPHCATNSYVKDKRKLHIKHRNEHMNKRHVVWYIHPQPLSLGYCASIGEKRPSATFPLHTVPLNANASSHQLGESHSCCWCCCYYSVGQLIDDASKHERWIQNKLNLTWLCIIHSIFYSYILAWFDTHSTSSKCK